MEFKLDKRTNIPLIRKEANEQNARWILRNISMNNNQELAQQAIAIAKDYLAKNKKVFKSRNEFLHGWARMSS